MENSEHRALKSICHLFIAVIFFFPLGMHGNKHGEMDAKFCGLRAILFLETDGERKKEQGGYWLSWKFLFLSKRELKVYREDRRDPLLIF